MKEPLHPEITGNHFAMKPWQILFCLFCFFVVPVLVKVLNEAPHGTEPAIPQVVTEPRDGQTTMAPLPAVVTDTTSQPPSAKNLAAYAEAESALEVIQAALIAGRNDEVGEPLRQALGSVEEMSFGSPERVSILIRIGVIYHTVQPEVGAALLHQAAAELDVYSAQQVPQESIDEALPWQLMHTLYRALGQHYHQQQRPDEAEPWLRRAVTAAEPGPDTPKKEIALRARQITDDLFLLAYSHCVAGNHGKSKTALAEMVLWCRKLPDPEAEVSINCRSVKEALC